MRRFDICLYLGPADRIKPQALIASRNMPRKLVWRAVVLCVDEKSQIQAPDRTQPGLPLKKGRAATMTHDHKRHGTTTLFAAQDVKSGMVIGECMPRHRAREFLSLPHAA